ncbi:MAG: hypothetical protein DHS20C16_13920 [Phycisphaerae bacterium]|nr:MAG: hypothetical protein DHS20C16_13920 [Phycisphaerae bacterium]
MDIASEKPATDLDLDQVEAESVAPADLPASALDFWADQEDLTELAKAKSISTDDVLGTLGPPPFPKTGFPFIGFLATVYDHVATQVGEHECSRDSTPA